MREIEEKTFSNKWFDQWIQTDSYLASDGHVNRIPLRLSSSNIIVYGIRRYLRNVVLNFFHKGACTNHVQGVAIELSPLYYYKGGQFIGAPCRQNLGHF